MFYIVSYSHSYVLVNRFGRTSETLDFKIISPVAKVTPADLEGMDNLTILYLHDNAVTDMGSSLKALKSLTLLDISGNKLTKVTVGSCVFANVPLSESIIYKMFINWSQVPEALPEHLHQLYLESNSIDSLPEGFLGGFTQLQYVRMAHNQITDKGIPPNTFNVTGLVELDLSFNKLERIPPVSTTLQHLYLQANQIKGKMHTCFIYQLCTLIFLENLFIMLF